MDYSCSWNNCCNSYSKYNNLEIDSDYEETKQRNLPNMQEELNVRDY